MRPPPWSDFAGATTATKGRSELAATPEAILTPRVRSDAAESAPVHRRLAAVVDLLAVCLEAQSHRDAVLALCNEAAARLACQRVSVALLHDEAPRVVSMSHSAVVDARSNLVRDLEQVMAEAIDEGCTVGSSDGGESVVAGAAHAEFARRNGVSHVLSVPLAADGRIVGAMTFEREDAAPFDPNQVALVNGLALLAGPVIELKRRNDRSPLRHALDTAGAALAQLVGPRRRRLKLLALVASGLVAWLALTQASYRITAPARIEGSMQRAVVAPLDGFVAAANARAGDTVVAGDVIAQLDDRELALDRTRLDGELAQLRTQYRAALAARDRAQSAILAARIARVEAQVGLLDAQLERTRLRAPIDGLVIAGDLSQLLGSPVARGDVLFEVAPLDGYRVVIEVDERDAGRVEPGRHGRLALQGRAGEALTRVVDQVTPVSIARDGRNFFRVEARIEAPPQGLRPGMSGYAKIESGERSRLWIWTHHATEWLTLRTWAWLP